MHEQRKHTGHLQDSVLKMEPCHMLCVPRRKVAKDFGISSKCCHEKRRQLRLEVKEKHVEEMYDDFRKTRNIVDP